MAGISFWIGDEQIEIGAKQKLSISLESPLLSENTIPGAVSFPFDLTPTAHNKRLLNISDTLMSFDENQHVKCKCKLGGNFWKNGFLIINNQKNLNVTFTEFNSEEDFNDKTLQDLPLKKLDTSEIFYYKNRNEKSQFHLDLIDRAEGNYPERDFVCASVFNLKTLDVSVAIGYQNFFCDGRYLPNYLNNGIPADDAFNFNTISPFLYLNYVLENLFSYFNIEIEYNLFNQSDLKDLILYTNKVNVLYADYVNNPTTEFFYKFGENEIDLSKYVPQISFSNFLTYLKNTFNLFYPIDWAENKVKISCKSEILKSFKTIDISDISSVYDGLTFNKNFKKITAISYEKSEDQILNDDVKRFSLKGYQYKGIVNSLSDIPIIPHKEFDYYILKTIADNTVDAYDIVFYDSNENWLSLTSRIKDSRPYDVYFSNESKNEYNFKLTTDTTVVRINKSFIAVPHADDIVTIEEVNKYKLFCPAVDIGVASNKNFGFYTNDQNAKTDYEVTKNLRLLFYRGMRQQMKNGGLHPISNVLFPFANRNEFDFTTTPSLSNNTLNFTDAFEHSLEIDGEKGLWNKFHREWRDFLSSLNRLVTFQTRFSPEQLLKNDLFLNQMQIDGNRFIISKITITADANTIYPCKTEMYQVEPK